MTCGCGEHEAKYLVYEDSQPHCLKCLLDAIECRIYVEVRLLDDADGYPHQSE